ncbi:MAG: hypothetical protein NTV80_00135, partial [Verrucomicrobia bacterium]|nr:hypothetical protein [Verrucomicrobiota bacterium]
MKTPRLILLSSLCVLTFNACTTQTAEDGLNTGTRTGGGLMKKGLLGAGIGGLLGALVGDRLINKNRNNNSGSSSGGSSSGSGNSNNNNNSSLQNHTGLITGAVAGGAVGLFADNMAQKEVQQK